MNTKVQYLPLQGCLQHSYGTYGTYGSYYEQGDNDDPPTS